MAALYYKYRTDFANTIISASTTPFVLGFNEKEIFSGNSITLVEPFYNYRYDGITVIANDSSIINHYIEYLKIANRFFYKEKVIVQTTTSSSLTNYDTITSFLSAGIYKITYSVIWGSSVTNNNATIEFRRNGANILPVQYVDRLSNVGQRIHTTNSKIVSTIGANETFAIAFATAGGTMTVYYSAIIIERII